MAEPASRRDYHSATTGAPSCRLGGDLAYELRAVTLGGKAKDGGMQPVTGKYVVVWKEGDGGVWRLHRDIWNMTPTSAPASD